MIDNSTSSQVSGASISYTDLVPGNWYEARWYNCKARTNGYSRYLIRVSSYAEIMNTIDDLAYNPHMHVHAGYYVCDKSTYLPIPVNNIFYDDLGLFFIQDVAFFTISEEELAMIMMAK